MRSNATPGPGDDRKGLGYGQLKQTFHAPYLAPSNFPYASPDEDLDDVELGDGSQDAVNKKVATFQPIDPGWSPGWADWPPSECFLLSIMLILSLIDLDFLNFFDLLLSVFTLGATRKILLLLGFSSFPWSLLILFPSEGVAHQ